MEQEDQAKMDCASGLYDPRAASISLETYGLWKLQILHPLSVVFYQQRLCTVSTPAHTFLSLSLRVLTASAHAADVATHFQQSWCVCRQRCHELLAGLSRTGSIQETRHSCSPVSNRHG